MNENNNKVVAGRQKILLATSTLAKPHKLEVREIWAYKFNVPPAAMATNQKHF